MRTLTPTTGLVGLKKEMDRLFDRIWEPDLIDLPLVGEWTPVLDMTETPEAFLVKLEVPGIEAKDIQVTLQDQVLTVKGEKLMEKEEKVERAYRMERAYGSFARAVRLPGTVDGKRVNASFKNGLLTIGLPKAPTSYGATIPIKVD